MSDNVEKVIVAWAMLFSGAVLGFVTAWSLLSTVS